MSSDLNAVMPPANALQNPFDPIITWPFAFFPTLSLAASFVVARCDSSPICEDMDNAPLVTVRSRLEDARVAVAQKSVTPDHYQQVDRAISGALGQLYFFHRSDRDGSISNHIQWAKPVDRPQHVEDLATAHSQGIKRIQAMVAEHNGPLEDLMLEPSKRAELKAIFEGAGEGQLLQLLKDMQRAKEVSEQWLF